MRQALTALAVLLGFLFLSPGTASATPFENCEEVYAAGESSITPDHPQWNPDLDGDENGIGCENPPSTPTTTPPATTTTDSTPPSSSPSAAPSSSSVVAPPTAVGATDSNTEGYVLRGSARPDEPLADTGVNPGLLVGLGLALLALGLGTVILARRRRT
jgi:hypothetical protein